MHNPHYLKMLVARRNEEHMQTPDKTEIIDCANAAHWEAWLARHYERSDGVWLRIAKKGLGIASVTISEALDIALCYGLIDSPRKGYDETSYLQRYSPYRPQNPSAQRKC